MGPVSIKETDPENVLFLKGTSMFPFLRSGDLIILENTAPKMLKIGDIVGFKNNPIDHVLVHRILKISPDKKGLIFTTKGDNNLSYDHSTLENELVGKVRYVFRGRKATDLESMPQRILAIFLSAFSKINLTFFNISDNAIVKFLKRQKWLAKFLGLCFKRNVTTNVFQLPDSKEVVRAFAGNKNVAHAVVDLSDPKSAILTDWFVKFPFYYSGQGKNFLKDLVEYFRDQGKDYLVFEKLNRENPAFYLFSDLEAEGILEVKPEIGTFIKLTKSLML